MNHYGRGSTRLTDVDDEEPFATQPQMDVNMTRRDSLSRNRNKGGRFDGEGIAVTTKIEQEVERKPTE